MQQKDPFDLRLGVVQTILPAIEGECAELVHDRLTTAVAICQSVFGEAWKPEHAIAIMVEIAEEVKRPNPGE